MSGEPSFDLAEFPEPGTANATPGSTPRLFYRVDRLIPTYVEIHENRTVVPESRATLVSSEISGSTLHAPAIDLDVPAYLIPSSTPGHSHLYLDTPMPWWKYRLLLRVLTFVGILEPGYYKASVRRRATHLRRPGVTKSTPTQMEDKVTIARIGLSIFS